MVKCNIRKNRHTLISVITLTLLILVSIMNFTTNQANASSEVLFKIRTKVSEQPIPGAELYINTTLQGTSNSAGEVSAEIDPNAIQDLVEVRYRGIVVFSESNFDPGGKSTITLNVTVDDMVIVVRDGAGRAIPNVDVTVTHSEESSVTETGETYSNGEVKFTLMPFGSYDINVINRGIVYEYTRGFDEASLRIELTLNVYRLRIKVNNAEGDPVEGALVKVWYNKDAGDGAAFEQDTTDITGYVTFNYMPEGEYSIQVFYNNLQIYSADRVVEILGSDKTHIINTNLRTYSVRVYDYDGENLMDDITISGRLLDLSNNPITSYVETTNGVINFGLIPEGDYILEIKFGNSIVYNNIVTVPTVDSVNADFYDVIIKINTDNMANSLYVQGLSISFETQDILSYEKDIETGTLPMSDLPKGTYEYTLKHGPYTVGRGSFRITEENQVITIEPVLLDILIYTKNDEGEAIKTKVELQTYEDKEIDTFITDENGTLSVNGLLPIEHKIKIYYNNILVFEDTLPLYENRTTFEMITEVYNLRVLVYDYDGEAKILSALVKVKMTDYEFERGAETDDEGVAELKNLPKGKYEIQVMYYGVVVYQDDSYTVLQSGMLQIKAGGIIDIRIVPVDSLGEPLDEGIVKISSGSVYFESGVKDGRARFENIPATTYRVEVEYLNVTVFDGFIDFETDELEEELETEVYYLTIKARRDDDTELTNTPVLVKLKNKVVRELVTDSAGRAVTRLPKSGYAVNVIFQGKVVGNNNVNLNSDKEVEIKTEVYKYRLSFVGIDGNALKDVNVLMYRGNELIVSEITDDEGVVEFYLAGGEYKWVANIGNVSMSSVINADKETSTVIAFTPDNVGNKVMILGGVGAVVGMSILGLFRTVTQHRKREDRRERRRARESTEPDRRPRTERSRAQRRHKVPKI